MWLRAPHVWVGVTVPLEWGQQPVEVLHVFVSKGQLARENAALRRQLGEWEALRARVLGPYVERTGKLEVLELHAALARVASLALQRGVPHDELMDAVKPDPRGVAVPSGRAADGGSRC